jgi:hypothetical protein
VYFNATSPGIAAQKIKKELVVKRTSKQRAAVVPALNDMLTESAHEESRASRHTEPLASPWPVIPARVVALNPQSVQSGGRKCDLVGAAKRQV